jgi:protein SCO1/2
MTSNRNVMLLIVVAAIAVSAGLWLGQGYFGKTPAGTAPPVQAALLYGEPRALEPFTLDRADGRPFTGDDLKGRWTLAFFGFTHCPDVCPTTLAQMKQVEAGLAASKPAPPLQLLFVSVDPARDSLELLAKYTAFFSPSIIAATASEDRLQPFTRQLGIVYMQSPLADGNYTVDHSAQLVLIDPDGRMAGMFRPPLDARKIVADLRLLDAAR